MNSYLKKTLLGVGVCWFITPCYATQTEPVKPTKPKITSINNFKNGVPGGMEQHSIDLKAVIKNINRHTREIIIEDELGVRRAVIVPTGLHNIAKLNQGDKLSLTLIEELVVDMNPNTVPQEGVLTRTVISSNKQQSKSQIIFADQISIRAKVKAIDLKAHTATLIFSDNSSRTVKVRKDVALKKEQIGKELTINTTKAAVLSVKKL
ncbi:MAG: hypothetical protein KAG53_04960 [Endozoicomonadaceae bacterium]|nr:hypothetical protein [Endozoicomonadaceae bacterium]